MANYGNIKYCDIANGPGIRTSIFISGCTHHCKNCFNPETWDFGYGEALTNDVIIQIINSADPDYISGITLLGGDPLCSEDNQIASHALCHMFKSKHPNKTIWLYTGYLFEQVKHLDVMEHVDVVVDGLFIEEKDITLQFRGSRNQRIIDVQRSLKEEKTILLEGYH